MHKLKLLSITGKHEAARKHMDKAIELDPLSFAIRWTSARLYFNRGRFQEILAENETANKLQTDHRLTQGLEFRIYYYLKDVDKAFDVLWKN